MAPADGRGSQNWLPERSQILEKAHDRGAALRSALIHRRQTGNLSVSNLVRGIRAGPPDAVVEAIQSELGNIMLLAGIHSDCHPLAEAGGRVGCPIPSNFGRSGVMRARLAGLMSAMGRFFPSSTSIAKECVFLYSQAWLGFPRRAGMLLTAGPWPASSPRAVAFPGGFRFDSIICTVFAGQIVRPLPNVPPLATAPVTLAIIRLHGGFARRAADHRY